MVEIGPLLRKLWPLKVAHVSPTPFPLPPHEIPENFQHANIWCYTVCYPITMHIRFVYKQTNLCLQTLTFFSFTFFFLIYFFDFGFSFSFSTWFFIIEPALLASVLYSSDRVCLFVASCFQLYIENILSLVLFRPG